MVWPKTPFLGASDRDFEPFPTYCPVELTFWYLGEKSSMRQNRSVALIHGSLLSRYRWVLAVAMVFCISVPSFSQGKVETIKFETSVLGLKIGDLNVKKYRTGDTLHYIAESKVRFWFFGNVDVEVVTHANYVNGYFVKSVSQSTTNRGNFASSIYWDGKKYVVDAKSYKFENKKPVTGLVKWCSTRAFFEELQDGETFISEVFGLTAKIEKPEPHVHSTTINGNQNLYFYELGKLQKVTLEHSVKNFQYKRVQ